MKYIHENFVNKEEIDNAENYGFTIDVQFCRDCPFFEIDGLQPDPDIGYGWCRRMSYYRTLFDNEYPHFVYVDSNSFCNKDDITEEDY